MVAFLFAWNERASPRCDIRDIHYRSVSLGPYSMSTVAHQPMLGRCWTSVSIVFVVCSALAALVRPRCSFCPIEHVESVMGSQWDISFWMAVQFSKPVHKKQNKSNESKQAVTQTKRAHLNLHLHLKCVNIFIMKWPSGTTKVKTIWSTWFILEMVCKRCFVYGLYIPIHVSGSCFKWRI